MVDDSETVQLMLRRRLEWEGYDVATASDGRGALDAMDSGTDPDVVLLDAMMPGMSGIEALRKLRDSGNETPVLIISAYRWGEEPEEAIELGANGCVAKPFDWDSLVDQIKSLTGSPN